MKNRCKMGCWGKTSGKAGRAFKNIFTTREQPALAKTFDV